MISYHSITSDVSTCPYLQELLYNNMVICSGWEHPKPAFTSQKTIQQHSVSNRERQPPFQQKLDATAPTTSKSQTHSQLSMQASSKQHHAITTSKTIRPYIRATGTNIQVKIQYKQSNQTNPSSNKWQAQVNQ